VSGTERGHQYIVCEVVRTPCGLESVCVEFNRVGRAPGWSRESVNTGKSVTCYTAVATTTHALSRAESNAG
jgi:hypothetical protein